MFFRRALFTFVIFVILGSKVGEAQVPEVHFLQKDQSGPIISLYEKASKTIYVAAYVITDSNIASALANASIKGVEVKVLLNERQVISNKFSQHWLLKKGRVEIRVMSSKLGRLISDFGIIDGKNLYTGGNLLHTDIKANPKLGNYLIFRNDKEMAEKHKEEFLTLFNEAHRLGSKK
jgi:hypothetical protein